MNEMFWLILILGILNFAILIANFVIIRKFDDFKDISDVWNKIAGGHSKMYHLILDQYKNMIEQYDSQQALFGTMCKQYDNITNQYETFSNLCEEYRKICKECVDRYGDAYDQFKLCTEKLDRIFSLQVSVSPEGFEADDEDIVI